MSSDGEDQILYAYCSNTDFEPSTTPNVVEVVVEETTISQDESEVPSTTVSVTTDDTAGQQQSDLPKFKTLVEVNAAIEKFQRETGTTYFKRGSDKRFAQEDYYPSARGHKILFEDVHSNRCKAAEKSDNVNGQRLLFTGIPFIILGCKTLECVHGRDYNYAKKLNKKRSKKTGCPAKIITRDIMSFPDFKISIKTQRRKRQVSEKLRQLLSENAELTIDRYFAVTFPNVNSHFGHSVGYSSGVTRVLDKRIVEKIHEMVRENVKNVHEMKHRLDNFVRNELGPDGDIPLNSRRYYPTIKDIRTHMHSATFKWKITLLDQNAVAGKVEEWTETIPNGKLYFRGYGEKFKEQNEGIVRNEDDVQAKVLPTKQRLLFAYQSADQKRLLERYGNHICVLDPVYKTIKYPIPLFFLTVKTNSDYQAVGLFVAQDETTESIAEALTIFKIWNPNFNPHVFLVDNCEEEINSVKGVFPQCNVLLSDFHREQRWERWLDATEHGMRHQKDTTLAILRTLALSESRDVYEQLVREFKSSEIWLTESSAKFKYWFKKCWLPSYKYWIKASRIGMMDIICETECGERKYTDLKHEFLKPYQGVVLSNFLTVLVEQHMPECYERYQTHNLRGACNFDCNEVIPKWMQERPKNVVEHLKQKQSLAKNISSQFVIQENERNFFVCEDNISSGYHVSFGTGSSYPNCECSDWAETMLPCQHMLAIFQTYSNYSWESLSPLYKYSPYLNLDEEIVGGMKREYHTAFELDDADGGDDDSYETEDMDFEEILPDYPKKSKAKDCRNLLNKILTLTYFVHESDVLNNLEEKLADIMSEMIETVPEESRCNLNLENKVDSNIEPIHKSRNTEIKMGNVLSKKEMIHVDDSIGKQSPMYSNTDHEYGIPIEEVVIESEKINPSENIAEFERNTSDELSAREAGNIKENKMLSDESIYMAQKLLAEKFDHIAGLQDPILLGKGKHYSHVEQNYPYIQILHTKAFHWVCVANMERKNNNADHFVYDSLHSKSIQSDIISQIAAYSHHPGPQLNIYVKSVQQQNNNVDGGVFAIAFATNIAYGIDPEDVIFDTKTMRDHLLKCLQNKDMTPFPTNAINCYKNNRRKEFIELFCLCRMPYLKTEECKMLVCDGCDEWFHTSCSVDVAIYDLLDMKKNLSWKCSACKNS